MPLIPKLKILSVSKSKLTAIDNTGDYSATNTGGFETPNPARADVTGVLISTRPLSSTVPATVRLNNTQQAGLLSTGVELTALQLGLSKFSDAVYHFDYRLAYAGVNQLTFAAEQKEFSMTDADVAFTNAIGFIIPALDPTKLYSIDRTAELSNTGGSVTETLPPDAGSYDIEVVYEGEGKMAVYIEGNECLITDIGKWSEGGCQNIHYKDILKRYMMKVAIGVKFDKQLYSEAHNLILKLNSYCSCC